MQRGWPTAVQAATCNVCVNTMTRSITALSCTVKHMFMLLAMLHIICSAWRRRFSNEHDMCFSEHGIESDVATAAAHVTVAQTRAGNSN